MTTESLYPIIVSENPEQTVSFYQNLGFKLKHDATTLTGSHVFVLYNGNLEIEVVKSVKDGPMKLSAGLYGFRMNVSDIDQAYRELQANGCTVIKPPFETSAGKNMVIKDDQGVTIILVQHIKK